MSFKEFVPTAQFGANYSHDDEIASSSTLAKYPTSSFDQSPYWPPTSATETGINERGYATYNNIVEIEDVSIGSQNGMNLSAASWVPPTISPATSIGPLRDQTVSQRDDKAYEGFPQNQRQNDEDYVEPFVEISWNEQSYFVPESTAYVYDEGMGYPQSLEVRDSSFRCLSSSLSYLFAATLKLLVCTIPSCLGGCGC
jgi:hypothetical protein